MRYHLKLLRGFYLPAILILSGTLANADPIPGIREIRTEFLGESYFKGVREFFTGREHTANRVIRRSSQERAGMYFILRFDRAIREWPASTRIQLELLRPGELEAASFELTIGDVAERGRFLYLGLTGEDWPTRQTQRPIAWTIRFRDTEGGLISKEKSFLWEYPN